MTLEETKAVLVVFKSYRTAQEACWKDLGEATDKAGTVEGCGLAVWGFQSRISEAQAWLNELIKKLGEYEQYLIVAQNKSEKKNK